MLSLDDAAKLLLRDAHNPALTRSTSPPSRNPKICLYVGGYESKLVTENDRAAHQHVKLLHLQGDRCNSDQGSGLTAPV
nr:hypothetical protein [Tanacetum cinerariifolium]